MNPRGAQALTDTQDDEGRVFPAGQQQEVDQVVGDEAEAQDHGTPLLEALACGEGRVGCVRLRHSLNCSSGLCQAPPTTHFTDSTTGSEKGLLQKQDTEHGVCL